VQKTETDRHFYTTRHDIVPSPSKFKLEAISFALSQASFEATHVPVHWSPIFGHVLHMQATAVDICSDLTCPITNQEELNVSVKHFWIFMVASTYPRGDHPFVVALESFHFPPSIP
jgi:hypothetical protein